MFRRLLAAAGLLAGLCPAVVAQTPEWIWGSAATNAETRYFRKNFLVPEWAAQAVLAVAGDNEADVFLNGRRVAKNADPSQVSWASLLGRLARGENTLAVVAKNTDGAAGLLVRIEFAGGDRKTNLVSDASWLTTRTPVAGWATNPPSGPAWVRATSLGQHGMAPWGDVMKPPVATPASALQVAAGFQVELIRSASPEEGSWVSMTVDDRGRLIISPQGNEPMLRLTLDAAGRVVAKEPINVPVRAAMGLLHAFGALYVNGQGPQGYHFYRLTDTNGDDAYDRYELLRRWNGGSGEHGAHGIVKGPDDRLYVINGNFVNVPDDVATNSPVRNYAEDLVLPRLEDGNGFGAGRKPPGGYVLRMDRDGGHAELFAAGQRNTYDLDFSPTGELFAFDSDMEWDWGTPWYRPTRVYQIVSGGEQGFREGSGKWPEYYADSLPPAVNVGVGSPTGVKFGTGTKFPAKFQRALFAMDWSYGRILAVHLRPNGTGFTGDFDTLLKGKPFNVTDLEVGRDGALYFTTGGRGTQSGLYRVTYAGPESTDPVPAPTAPKLNVIEPSSLARLPFRSQLEYFHTHEDPRLVATYWPALRSEDRHVRFAARVALENQPVATWADKALAETNSTGGLTALLALARVGGADRQLPLLQALARWPLDSLGEDDFLLKLRVIEVSFARHGIPAAMRPRALEKLGAQYPAKTWPRNRELVQLLVALAAPDLVGKTLELRDAAATQEEQLHYQIALCRVTDGWTTELRRRFFRWFADQPGTGTRRAEHPPEFAPWFKDVGLKVNNGSSYENFLKNVRSLALQAVPPAELADITMILSGQAPAPAIAAPTTPRPNVREWKTEDLLPLLGKLAEPRNRQRGREIYAAAQCGSCHRLEGAGGAVGPDLTGVAARFAPADLLKSLTEPSAVVSEQYQFTILHLKSGEDVVGRIVSDAAGKVTVMTDPLKGTTVELRAAEVESRRPSPLSPMPEGLLNSFQADEILDLLAYLLKPAQ